MVGQGYSTKFAPWLARGCLSPRRVAHECAKYEQQRVANKSTYWVKFELTWRDYFIYYAHKYGEKLFFPYGVKGSSRKWRVDSNALRAWKEGRTGAPLVDANMRELRATGFMSNRGRQNVRPRVRNANRPRQYAGLCGVARRWRAASTPSPLPRSRRGRHLDAIAAKHRRLASI